MPATGIAQYLKYGTGATADTYAGRVTGGEVAQDSAMVWRPSVGGKNALGRGIAIIGGRASIEVANSTLLAYFTRASFTSPSLSSLTFEGAYVGTDAHGWTHTGCQINSLEVALGVGDPLTATLEWFATDQADQGSPTVPTGSATHWEWYQGTCTFNGTTYTLQRMTVRADNGLERYSDIETHATNALVLPEGFKVGSQKVSVSAEMLTRPSTSLWNLHEDAAVSGVTAQVSATDGVHTITFALANLAGSRVRMPFETDDGMVVFSLDLEGEPNASNTLTISYS